MQQSDKILLFGAGSDGKKLLAEMRYRSDVFNDDIVTVVDNDVRKVGTKIANHNICVSSPQIIHQVVYDRIVIATSDYETEIRQQLISMGINDARLISRNEYCIEKYVKRGYQRYRLHHRNATGEKHKGDIVIYTAITGDYDELKEPLYTDSSLTYICFTDNPSLKSENWKIEYITDTKRSSPKLLSRWYKLHPHKLFPNHEVSIWVDGKFEIRGDLRQYLERYMDGREMLLFPHYRRDCIYAEAAVCMERYLDDPKVIIDQMLTYRREGYPTYNGLYDMGLIVRKHHCERVIQVMQKWYEQLLNHSLRDQLSFPYVIWKCDFVPAISNEYIYGNSWLKVYSHKG